MDMVSGSMPFSLSGSKSMNSESDGSNDDSKKIEHVGESSSNSQLGRFVMNTGYFSTEYLL